MTEEEWLSSSFPDVLLDYAKANKELSNRRARLFGCACFRLAWEKIGTELLAGVVETAEARADRRVKQEAFARIQFPRINLNDNTVTYVAMATHAIAQPRVTPGYVAWLVRVAADAANVNSQYGIAHQRYGVPDQPQADLLRDIFGNPFRPVTLDPRWLFFHCPRSRPHHLR